MANITINDETVATSAAASDEILFWSVSGGYQRKITKANFLGGSMTGGGVLATGGFTLTVPATGTASLLAVAQTYSALKTYSAGINFGQTTLNYYLEDGTFTPTLYDASSGGNAASITQAQGWYTRVGDMCFTSIRLNGITTSGMTGGNTAFIRDLPFTARNTSNRRAYGSCSVVNCAFTSGAYLNVMVTPNTTYADIRKSYTSGGSATLIVSELTSGSAQIYCDVTYLVA